MHGPIDADDDRDERHDGASCDDARAGAGGDLGPSEHPYPMPDPATTTPVEAACALDRVGMSRVELMVRLPGEDGGELLLPATADAFVSLDDPQARGIHMSRLYLDLQRRLEREPLTPALVASLLEDFIASQQGLSSRSEVRIRFLQPLHRPALVSANRGWRHYPVELAGWAEGGRIRLAQTVTVTYSSTCPCSAALARQATQEAFDRDFAGRDGVPAAEVRAWLGERHGMPATPHSQRSSAEVTLVPESAAAAPDLWALVDRIEAVLATPVQTAVKREDEQAFALRNGSHLMFCEDAARRIKGTLDAVPGLADYRIRADHHESLHPHDASAVVVKGVAHGLRP